jgi:hypothetical protein
MPDGHFSRRCPLTHPALTDPAARKQVARMLRYWRNHIKAQEKKVESITNDFEERSLQYELLLGADEFFKGARIMLAVIGHKQ